jgi:hypothetical protein
MPEALGESKCDVCDGSGYSPEARELHNQWYGYIDFKPADTGSSPFTIDTPEVRAYAERNVANSPHYYGPGEWSIRKEAQRLADLWNGSWSHHLSQDDVDALVAEGRLRDFTHNWTREGGWNPKDPAQTVTADQVNRWSLGGSGHDSINCDVVIEARCERSSTPYRCAACEGQGSMEKYPGQRAEAEAWEPTNPPEGEGWQLWETVSEGSPITPVFASKEELARYIATPAYTWSHGAKITYEQALSMVDAGWAPSMIVSGGKLYTAEQSAEVGA